MIDTEIRVDIERTQRAIRELPGKVPNRILAVSTLAAARVIQRQVKMRGYRFNDRTGRLRRSVKVKRGKVKRGNDTIFSKIQMGGEGARQAVLIELGTVKAKGRTPLQSARDATVSQQVQAYTQKADQELRKLEKELLSGNVRPVTARALAG